MEAPEPSPIPLMENLSMGPTSLEKEFMEPPSIEKSPVTIPTLKNLPVEIFMRIVDFLGTAKDVTNLSQSCTQLSVMSKEHAWRRFVLSKFPTITYTLQISASKHLTSKFQLNKLDQPVENAADGSERFPPSRMSGLQWEHLAKTLTSQSRAWDRRAFSISRIAPLFHARADIEHPSMLSKSGQLTRYEIENGTYKKFGLGRAAQGPPSGAQTTGYHPVVDAKLQLSNCLHNKKEIVAWSTGAKVFLRVRRSGVFSPSEKEHVASKNLVNDAYNNITNTAFLSHEDYREGLDDVVALNIVPPTVGIRATQSDFVVDVIVGRASGYLNRFSINMCPVINPRGGLPEDQDKVIVNTFVPGSKRGHTSRSRITSADVYGDEASYLACTSDGFLSLYQTESSTHNVEPLDEVKVENWSQNRTRAVKFLSHEKVVVGIERHNQALRTFQIAPDGLRLIDKLSTTVYDVANQTETEGQSIINSIYALEPISCASRPGGNLNGDVFLSGWFDGVVRLYDLRASRLPVACYGGHDSLSVYSLAAYGQERFIAGTSRSKLQVFDFRLGSKLYSYTEALPCNPKKADDVERETPKLRRPAASHTHGNGEYTNESSSHTVSDMQLPKFPSRLHNTVNFQNRDISTTNLQDPCSNAASKLQKQYRELQPELYKNLVFPSIEALYKQEDLRNRTLWHAAPKETDKKKNPHMVWEDCHFDLREGPSKRCNFHKDAGHNFDTNVFVYGQPTRRRNDFTNRARPSGVDEVESPIFSLASPSPLSPIVYIGSLGTVYEMAVSEFGIQGQITDPYFNDAPYALQTNTLTKTTMYEMKASKLEFHYQSLKHAVQPSFGGLRASETILGDGSLRQCSMIKVRNAEGRLDRRWFRSLGGHTP